MNILHGYIVVIVGQTKQDSRALWGLFSDQIKADKLISTSIKMFPLFQNTAVSSHSVVLVSHSVHILWLWGCIPLIAVENVTALAFCQV